MSLHKHVVIVAGEASGDHHAAQLVKQLIQLNSGIKFSGIGGTKMQQAGVELIYNLAQFGVVGFIEVINHFKIIRQAFKSIQQKLIDNKPDLLILVDYPGFNLRLAKFAKSLGIKILYYISPQIWAWKENRIHTIKKNIDMMAVILPFEKQYYQAAGVPVRFVGHPLTSSVKVELSPAQVREKFGFKQDSTIIGLLPGSRKMEIKHLLPIMLQASEQLSASYDNLEFVIPLASSIASQEINSYLNNTQLKIKIIPDQTYNIINCCHCLLIASGTATLEAALLQKPMIIVFKTSWLTYTIATQVIKTKYIGLCNLLAQKLIVPEIIQHDLTAEHLTQVATDFISQDNLYTKTQAELFKIKNMLAETNVDCSLPDLVLEMLITNTPSHQGRPE